MITAKQLREQLADIPDNIPIILQTDDEGNGYRYISGIDFAIPGIGGNDANFFNREDDAIRASDIEDDPDLAVEYDQLVAVIW